MKYIPEKMTYKEYEESYTVRHIADTVGFMYLFVLAIQLVWEFVILKWLLAAGISLTTIQKYLSDPAISLTVNVLITAIMFTVPFIALCGRERQKPSTLIHYGSPKKGTFLPLVALGSGLCMVANAAASIITEILNLFGIEGKNTLENLPEGVFGMALTVIAVSLAPAVLEEFSCRGIVFGVARKLGEGFAIFVSAIFFSIMHMNANQIPFAFMAGIVLAFVYVKSESIWTAVAVHAINNLLSVILSIAMDGVSSKISQLIYLTVIAVAAAVSLAAFSFYTKNGGNFVLCASNMELSSKKKFIWFIKSPTVIVSIVASLAIMELL